MTKLRQEERQRGERAEGEAHHWRRDRTGIYTLI